MRISDWSSDVCSSDLDDEGAFLQHAGAVLAITRQPRQIGDQRIARAGQTIEQGRLADIGTADENEGGQLVAGHGEIVGEASTTRKEGSALARRSDARRVGKEGGSMCSSRWSAYHQKKKKRETEN